MLQRLFNIIKAHQYQIFLAVCILMIAFISFNLGKIASNEKGSIKITSDANIYKATQTENNPSTSSEPLAPKATPKPLDLRVVVSKASDSRKYHHFWCGSWKKIKLENQLWYKKPKKGKEDRFNLKRNNTGSIAS